MVSYHDMILNQNLNRWVSNVTGTSRDSYSHLINKGVVGTQITAMLELYASMPEGLSDESMQMELGRRGVQMDKSTVSARRNDINKQHLLWCDKNHLFGDSLIKSFPTRTTNKTGHSANIWGLSRYMKVMDNVY